MERRIYTPSEISHQIKTILTNTFFDIWVEGEISNLRIPSSAHAYFILKDERSQIRVVMFKSRRRFLRFDLENGLHVLIRGSIDVYAPRGEYQLIAELVQPKGTGALELAFKQLKVKLEKEGLFSPDHKTPLPFLPHRIGVITSPTGAAIRDLLKVLKNRFPNLAIIVNPVKVQGEGAAKEIADAIREMNKQEMLADLLIVTRGGGSTEDLWCFNEEILARAIFESHIPIISAVGHEIDFTIADFVADARAPTPTAAGELAVPKKEELTERINSLTNRMARGIKHQIKDVKHRLGICWAKRVFLQPDRIIRDRRQQLDYFEIRMKETLKYLPEKEKLSRLTTSLHMRSPLTRIATHAGILEGKKHLLEIAIRSYLKNNRINFQYFVGKLETLSPLSVLGRGYAICRRITDRKVITDVQDVKPEDRVKVHVNKGEMICAVLNTSESLPDR